MTLRFNVMGFCLAIFTIALPVATLLTAVLGGGGASSQSYQGLKTIFALAYVMAILSFTGLVLSIIAATRGEPRPWMTFVGGLANLLVFMLLLWTWGALSQR